VSRCLKFSRLTLTVISAAVGAAVALFWEHLRATKSVRDSLDAYSAWRLLPDLQLGIIQIHAEPQLDKMLASGSPV
jgi:hypothetical protein